MDRPIYALPSRRRHLFEWEDQRWLPSSLRNVVTDHLRHVFASTRPRRCAQQWSMSWKDLFVDLEPHISSMCAPVVAAPCRL